MSSMRHRVCLAVSLFCLLGTGCAHYPPKPKTLVFRDVANEKKVTDLREKIRLNDKDIGSRMKLGRIFLAEDMPKEAIVEFEKVLSIDSCKVSAYLLLATALQKCPEPDLTKVTTLLEKARQIAPENTDVHLHLGQVYTKTKKDEQAIREFNEVIASSNDEANLVSAHLGLMAIYQRRGEKVKAEKEYQAAYRIYPGVEEMLRQAEISRITPAPKYAGEDMRGDDGLHPTHEERIKRVGAGIDRLSAEEK